jgi:uncharacterized RDD family membrane protein YckC
MSENIEESAAETTFEKAGLLERYVAKLVDVLIAGALFFLPPPVGPAAAITYLLISDGLKNGPSPGKRLAGLRVVSLARDGAACDFRESILRNLPLGLLVLAYIVIGWIPYIGTFSVVLVALAVVAYESMIVYNDERGIRFGDRIADTMVVGAG